MTRQEFTAEVYRILEKHGHIEANGALYYPEASIIEAMEYLYKKAGSIPQENLELMLIERIELSLNKLFNGSPKGGPCQNDKDPDPEASDF